MITKTMLAEAAEMMSRTTGRTYQVVPFPGGPGSGYNLVQGDKPENYVVIKGGRPARELFEWIHAYILGFRHAKSGHAF